MPSDEGKREGLLQQIQRTRRSHDRGLLSQVRGCLVSSSLDPLVEPMAAAARAARPSSKAFWAVYLNYDLIPPSKNVEVWKRVGGWLGKNFGDPPQDSCATRVSYGLNYGGAPIPARTAGSFFNDKRVTFAEKAGDEKHYIVNVGKLHAYLSKAWGPPDHRQIKTVEELNATIGGLAEGQCAIFATRKSPGHSGVLKRGYQDPYVNYELPLDVWILPVP